MGNIIGTGVDYLTGNNAEFVPVPAFHFVLLVEGMYYLPLRSVHVFNRENEYEYIQEGGVNDYVHMKRKPISKPFTFQIEKYIDTGVTRFLDPLSNGTELILPCILFVYRSAAARGWGSDTEAKAWAARYYTFTGCVVQSKEYGELNSEKSGLHTETITIAYKELMVITNPVDSSTKEDQWTFEYGLNMTSASTYDPKNRRKDGTFNNKMKTLKAKASPNDFNAKDGKGYSINGNTIMDNTGKIVPKKDDKGKDLPTIFEIPSDYSADKRRDGGKYSKVFVPIHAEQSKNDMGSKDYKGYSINGKMLVDKDGKVINPYYDMEEQKGKNPPKPVSPNVKTSDQDHQDWLINKDQKKKDPYDIPKDYKAEKRRDGGKYSAVYPPVSATQSKYDMGSKDYNGYYVNGKMLVDKEGVVQNTSYDMEKQKDQKPPKPVSPNVATSDQDHKDWLINKDQKKKDPYEMPTGYKAEKRRDNGKYSNIYKPVSAAQSPNDMGNENYKGYMLNDKTIIDMKDNQLTPAFNMKDEMSLAPHKPISDNIVTSPQDGTDWRINESQSSEDAFDMKKADQIRPVPATSHVDTSKQDHAQWGVNETQKPGAVFEMSSIDTELPKPMSPNIKTSPVDKPLAPPVTWPPTRRALMAEALSKK